MKPVTRRFNMGDLMILIASVAFALVGVRSLWSGHIQGRGVIASKSLAYDRLLVTSMVSACATPLTVACLMFRLRRPRPSWRRVALQPGTAALLACVVIFAARTLETSASLALPDAYKFGSLVLGKTSPISFGDSTELVLKRFRTDGGVIGHIEPFACHGVLVAGFASPCGPTVAAVWMVIGLAGRWRSEKSWVDRLGRTLGVTWIVCSALTAYPF